MDPHPLPDIEETSTTDLAEVTISAKHASATGLSAFDPRSVTVIDSNVAFELAFPAIGISADYSDKDEAENQNDRLSSSSNVFFLSQ